MAIFLVLALTAHQSRAQATLTDLMEHSTGMTFIAVGRAPIILPKVGDTPCFSKLFTGEKAFGTVNDSWFGGPPSASDQPVSLLEMSALVREVNEHGLLAKAEHRTVKQSDIKNPSSGSPLYLYEGSRSNLVSAAIALGYQDNDLIHYYLLPIEDRHMAIRFLEQAQIILQTNTDAHCALGNILWRLKQEASQQSLAPDGAQQVEDKPKE